MLKRLKSVSMLLFLMGASTGAAYAVANPGVTDVKITQQTGTCFASSRMLREKVFHTSDMR